MHKHFAHSRGDLLRLQLHFHLHRRGLYGRRAEQMASHDGDELEAVSFALRTALSTALSTIRGACVHKQVYMVPARLATRAAAACCPCPAANQTC